MKRTATLLMTTCLIAGTAAIALAAQPTPGTYYSTDHPINPGQVLTGHGSNSWSTPNGNQNSDAVFNSDSWDGATLGTQWRYECGVSIGPETVQDNRVGGTGTVVYTVNYSGGTFFLSKNGPWGDGVNDLTGTIGGTTTITTVQFVGGTPVGSRLNIDSSGSFDGSTCTLRYVVSNGTGAGETDLGNVKGSDYPDFLDTSCLSTRIYGSWGVIQDIQMEIDCPTPNKPATWGTIKSQYK